MSPLRLTGSTSGYSQIDAPAVAGDQTFTLPGTGGTLTTTNGGQTVAFGAGSASAPSITATGDSNTGVFFPAADTIAFAEGGTESARLDSSGRLLVGTSSATANGGVLQVSNGITFPAAQVACSDPNTLDDYEEGTWTPTITTDATNPTITIVTGYTGAKYTKIGNIVYYTFEVRWSAVSGGSGNINITGLPFARANTQLPDGDRGVLDMYGVSVPAGGIFGIISIGRTSTVINTSFIVSSSATVNLTAGNLGVGTGGVGYIRGNGFYAVS